MKSCLYLYVHICVMNRFRLCVNQLTHWQPFHRSNLIKNAFVARIYIMIYSLVSRIGNKDNTKVTETRVIFQTVQEGIKLSSVLGAQKSCSNQIAGFQVFVLRALSKVLCLQGQQFDLLFFESEYKNHARKFYDRGCFISCILCR